MEKEFEDQYKQDHDEAVAQLDEKKVIEYKRAKNTKSRDGAIVLNFQYPEKFKKMRLHHDWEKLISDYSDNADNDSKNYYDYYLRLLYDDEIMRALFLYSYGFASEKASFFSFCIKEDDNDRLSFLVKLLMDSFETGDDNRELYDWEKEAFEVLKSILSHAKKNAIRLSKYDIFNENNISDIYDKIIQLFSGEYKTQLEVAHLYFDSGEKVEEVFNQRKEEYFEFMKEFEPLHAQKFIHDRDLYNRKQNLRPIASEKMKDIQTFAPILFYVKKGDAYICFLKETFEKAPSYSVENYEPMLLILDPEDVESVIKETPELLEQYVFYRKNKHPERDVTLRRATEWVKDRVIEVNKTIDDKMKNAGH